MTNGCSTWDSICCTATTASNMNNAVQGPCATRATRTATRPETNAPTIGTKAPKKTRTPIASVSGTPRAHADKEIPKASINATTTVARMNDVSDFHAVWPEELTRSREARGNSRTSHDHMRSPSY